MDNFENTFVIECCENCRNHQWNTRHDPAKYEEFYTKSKYNPPNDRFPTVVGAISSRIPEANVLKNNIPKEWVDYDIYCQLLPDEDPDNHTYAQIPRIGAFEVSYKGVVSFLF